MKNIFKTPFVALACICAMWACDDKAGADADASGDGKPYIISIIPYTGVAGSAAIISGVNFSETAADNSVQINGKAAEVLHAASDRLTIVLPANPAGTYDVTVKVGENSAGGATYAYVDKLEIPLAIVNLIPSSGYVGDRLVIYGQGFSAAASENSVTLNGVSAEVTFATANILHVTAPDNPDGAAAVIVEVNGNTASGLAFEYLHLPELSMFDVVPTSGRPGETIVITGECFSEEPGGNKLVINGVEAEIVNATTTRITAIAPENPEGAYSLSLTVDGKTIEGPTFTYVARKYLVTTVAGNDNMGAIDGIGTAATFQHPQDIRFDKDGKLWIVQRGVFAIRKMDPSDYSVTTIVPSTESLLKSPWQGDFDSNGDFYVVNKDGKNILKVTPQGVCTEYVVSNTTFNSPMALVFDSDGNIYLADRNNNKVKKIANGQVVKEYAVTMPQTIAIDRNGMLILGTYNLNKLLMLNPDTEVLTDIAGTGVRPTAATYTDGEEGNALSATVAIVDGICCTSDGAIFFTDEFAKTVRKLTPDATGDYAKGTVTTIAGAPFTQAVKDGDAISEAAFCYPYGIVVADDLETIYVTDGSSSHRIRKIYYN